MYIKKPKVMVLLIIEERLIGKIHTIKSFYYIQAFCTRQFVTHKQ